MSSEIDEEFKILTGKQKKAAYLNQCFICAFKYVQIILQVDIWLFPP